MRIKQTFDLDQRSATTGPKQTGVRRTSARGATSPEDLDARPDGSSDASTRLLQAALELFGKRGFSETSVRELSVAAGVNIAAVNYHFGSKDQLRIEALRYGFAPITPVIGALQEICGEARKSGTTVAAEAALRRFIAVFLKEAVGREGKHWAMS